MGAGKSCVSFWVESLEIDETGEGERCLLLTYNLFLGGGLYARLFFFHPFLQQQR